MRTCYRFKKSIALFTVLAFFCQNTVWAAPQITPGSNTAREFRVSPPDIHIPGQWGEIKETFDNPAAGSFVVHIQNAHGNYRAQKNIQKIINLLHKQYKVRCLFLEGANDQLDLSVFRFFEDNRMNLKVADLLMRQGEFTGAEMFLLGQGENAAGGAEGYGIEDTELYRRDFELFRKVLDGKEKAEALFKALDERITRAESRIFSKELRLFVNEWRKFKSASGGLLGYIRYLRQYGLKYLFLDLKDPKHQAEYGTLLRILKLKEIEGRLDTAKIGAEKKALLEFLKDKIDKKSYRRLERLDPSANKKPAGQPEQAADGPGYPRLVFEKILQQVSSKEPGSEGPRFDFRNYPNYTLFAEYLILESEIDSQRLFEETERFSEELFKALAKTAEEKELLRLILDSELLRKLLTLELSRSEHEKVLSGKEFLSPAALNRRLAGLAREKTADSHGPDETAWDGFFSDALQFYALALEREKYFLEKTMNTMREKNEAVSVVVTGGFHAGGVLRLLNEKGIPHISIMPRLAEAEQGHAIYLRAMMGETRLAETAQIEKALRELPAASREKLIGPELMAADHALDLEAVRLVAASLGTEALNQAAVAHPLRYVFYSELPPAQKRRLGAKLEGWGYGVYSEGWKGDLDALVAFSGQDPAGLQAFMMHRESDSVYATGLYAGKEFRRNGYRVGSRVREELLARLKEMGFKEFNIPGIDKTEAAQKFYKHWLAELGDSVIEVNYYPEDPKSIKSIAVDLTKLQPVREESVVAASLGTGEPVLLDDFQDLSFAAVQPQQYVTLKGKLYGEDYVIRVFQDREAWKYELSVWNQTRSNPKLWLYLPQTSASGVLKARDSGKISKLFDRPGRKASIRLKRGAPFLAFRIPNGILMQEHQRYLYALNQVGVPFPAGSQAMVIPVLRHAAEVLSAFQEEGFLYAKGEYSPADFSVNPNTREVILINPGKLVRAAKSGPGRQALAESMQVALYKLAFGYATISEIMHSLTVRLYQYVNKSPDNTDDGSIRLSLEWMKEVFIPLLERGAEMDVWLEGIEDRLKRGDKAAQAELESRASSSDDIDPVSRALMVQVLNQLHKEDSTEFDFTRLYEQGYEEFSHRGARYLFVLRNTAAGDYTTLDAYQVLGPPEPGAGGRGPGNPRIVHVGYVDALTRQSEIVINRLNWKARINASVLKPAAREYLKTKFGLDEKTFSKTFDAKRFLQGNEVSVSEGFDQWPALEVREDYRGLKLGQLLFASMLGLAIKERRPLIHLEEVGPVDFYTRFIEESKRAGAVVPDEELPDIVFRVPDDLNLRPTRDFEIRRGPAGKISFVIAQSLGEDKFRQVTLEDLFREGPGGRHLFLSFYTGDGRIEWFQIGLDGRVRYFRQAASFDLGGKPESETEVSWKWLSPSDAGDAAILGRPEVKIFTDQIKGKAGQPMLLAAGVASGVDALIFPDGTFFPVSYVDAEQRPLVDLSLRLDAKTYPDLQRASEVRQFLSGASLGEEKVPAWSEERDRLAGEIFENLKASPDYQKVLEKATRPGKNGINPPDYTDIWDFALAQLSGKTFTAERRDIVNRVIDLVKRDGKSRPLTGSSLGVSAEEDAVFSRLGEKLAETKPDTLLPLTVDRLARENARHLVNEARQNHQSVEALTVCTANYHRSASMDWLLKIAAKKEGLEDFRVNSGGTALWDSGEMTNILIPQRLRGAVSGLNPALLSHLLLVTGSPDAALTAPGSLQAAVLTDEHLRQLYFRFDETAWRNRIMTSGLPEMEQRPYLETAASAAEILRSFDQQVASEQRLDNRIFRETASQALSDEERPALAEAQQSYGGPKTITRTMIHNATVIIVAGEEHKRMIEYYFPEAAHKTFLFTELAPEVFSGRKDVPDPGKGEIRERDLFEALSRNIERAVYPLFQKQEPRDIFTGAGEKGLLTVTEVKLPAPGQTGRIQGFLRQTRAVENPPFTLPLIHAPPAKDRLVRQLNNLLASPAYTHFEVASPRLAALISRALAWFQDPEGFQGNLAILTEHPQIKEIGLPNVIAVSVEFKEDAAAWLHAIFQAAVAEGVINEGEIPAVLSSEAGHWYYSYFPGEDQDAALRRYATVEIIKWIFSELHHRLAVQIAGDDVAAEDIKAELHMIQEILLETMDREHQGLVIRPEEVWEEVARQEELMPDSSRKGSRQAWYFANQTVLERKYWNARGSQEDINRRIDHAERMIHELRARLAGKTRGLAQETMRFLADVRYQIAMDAAERGHLSKAYYILGQLEHAEGVDSVFVPELRQALSNYKQFQAAREALFQGNAEVAGTILESLKAEKAQPWLIQQIASGVEKLSGLPEPPAIQSLTAAEIHRRIAQQDRVQFLAGAKTAWVFKLNEYPNLVFKISLTGDNGAHYEDESLHLWQVARQAGYELQAVDGLMLIKIPGFAPVAYLEGVIVEHLAKPLPGMDDHALSDADKERAVGKAIEFQKQLAERGVRWLDVKPDNLGEISGEEVLIDNGFVYAEQDAAQASSLGAEEKAAFLTESEVRRILTEEYGLAPDLNLTPLVSHNAQETDRFTPFLVTAGDKKFVFRTAGFNARGARYNAALMNHLHSKGLPVPAVASRSRIEPSDYAVDRYLYQAGGRFYALEEYLESGTQILRRDQYEEKHYEALGRLAADIYIATRDFSPEVAATWKSPIETGGQIDLQKLEAIRQGLEAKEADSRSEGENYFVEHYQEIQRLLTENLIRFRNVYTEALQSRFKDSRIPGSPQAGHVHNDLHPGNVRFVESGGIVSVSALYDFDIARVDNRIAEFNNMIFGAVLPWEEIDFDEKFVRAAVNGYQEEIRARLPGHELNEAELTGIREILRLRLLWNAYLNLTSTGNGNLLHHPERIPGFEKTLNALRQFDAAQSLGAEPKEQFVLRPAVFSLAAYFGADEKIEQIILVADNSGTLTPDESIPLSGGILSGLQTFLSGANHYLVVNSGDPLADLLGKSHRPLIDSLAKPEERGRYFVIGDGGSRETRFLPDGGEQVNHLVEDWSPETGVSFAKFMTESFYDRLKTRPGRLAELLSQVTDEEIEASRQDALQRLAAIESQNTWGGQAAGERQPMYRFDVLSEAFAVKYRNILGDVFIYDVGPKQTFRVVESAPEAYAPSFYQQIASETQAHFSAGHPDLRASFGAAAPREGFVDLTRITKADAVEKVLREQVFPKLDPNKKTLVFVIGDGGNDIPTFRLFSGEPNVIVVPVLLNQNPDYAKLLPENARVGKERLDGALETIRYANDISGKAAAQTPELELFKWHAAASLGEEQEEAMIGLWEAILSEAENGGEAGFGRIFRANARFREAAETLKGLGLAFLPWAVEIDSPSLLALLKTDRQKRLKYARQFVGDRLDRDGHLLFGPEEKGFGSEIALEWVKPALAIFVENIIQHAGSGFIFFFKTAGGFRAMILDAGAGMDLETWSRGEMAEQGDRHEALRLLLEERAPVRILSKGREYDFWAAEGPRVKEGLPGRGTLVVLGGKFSGPQASSLGAASREIPEINGVVFDALKTEDAGKVLAPVIYELDQKYQALRPRFMGPAEPMPSRNVLAVFRFTAPGVIKIALSPALAEKKGEVYQYGHSELAGKAHLSDHSFGFVEFSLALDKTDVRFRPDINGPGYTMYADVMHNQAVRTARMLIDILRNMTDGAGTRLYTEDEIAQTGFLMDLTKQNEIEQVFSLERPGVRQRIDGGKPHRLLLTGVAGLELIEYSDPNDELSPELPVIPGKTPLAARQAIQSLNAAFEALVPLGREKAGELMDRISLVESYLTQASYAEAHKSLARALRFIERLENPQGGGRSVAIPDAAKNKIREALNAALALQGQKPQGASLGIEQSLSREITQFMMRWEAELRDPSGRFHKTALEFLAPIYLARVRRGGDLPYEFLTPLADSNEDGVAQNVFRLLADADLIRIQEGREPRSLALLEAKAAEHSWPQDTDYYRFHYALYNLARLNAAMENPGSLPVFANVLHSAETPSGWVIWRRWQTRALRGSLLIALSASPNLLYLDNDVSGTLHAFVKKSFVEDSGYDVEQFAAGAMAQADLFLISQGRAPEFLPLIETAEPGVRGGAELRSALFNAHSEIQSALIEKGVIGVDPVSLQRTVETLVQAGESHRSLDWVTDLAAVVMTAIRKGVRPADETLAIFKLSISRHLSKYKVYVTAMGGIEAALIEQGMPGYFSPFLKSEFEQGGLEMPRAYSTVSENLDEMIDALGQIDAAHLKQGRPPEFLSALHEMGLAILNKTRETRTYGDSSRQGHILQALTRADMVRIENGEEPAFVSFFEKGAADPRDEIAFIAVNSLMRLNAAWIQQGLVPRLLAPVFTALRRFNASRYERYQILPAFFFAVAIEKGVVDEEALRRSGLWAKEAIPFQETLVSEYLGAIDPEAFIASIERPGGPVREAQAVYQMQEFDLSPAAGPGDGLRLFTGRELGLLPSPPASRIRQVIKISDTAPNSEAFGDGASQYERLLQGSLEHYSTYDPARRMDESVAGREIQASLDPAKFQKMFHSLALIVEQSPALEAGDLSMVFGDLMQRSPEMKEAITGLLVEIAVLSESAAALDRQTAIKILRSAEIGEVVLVAAESLTTSTAGGLPLYVSDLAEELANLGIKATLMVPIFSDEAQRIMEQHAFRNTGHLVEVPLTDGSVQRQRISIYETKVGKVRVIGLVNERYFNSLNRGHDSVYNGNGRQKLRFAYLLSMGALQACEALHISPNVLHANEWSTAYLRTNLQRFKQSPAFAGTKALYAANSAQVGYDGTVYTANAHDRDAMIRFDLRTDPGMNRLALGLPEGKDPIGGKSLIANPNEPNHINPLATAFMSFDDVVTVSEGYYERSLWDDKEFGDLSWILRLRQREGDYGWIRSGFNKVARQRAFMAEAMKDEGFRQLMTGFGYHEPVSFLEIGHDAVRRQIARYLFDHLREKFQERLQEAAGLPKRKDAIVISSLSRINGQKGHQLLLAPVFDISNPEVLHDYTGIYPVVPDVRLSPEDSRKLADKVLDTGYGRRWERRKTLTALEVILTLNPDVQFVVVGSVDQRGDWYDQGLSEAQRNFPDQIYYRPEFIRMEDPLYHLIYWGSRIFEASSWFEPFGLAPREAAAFGLLRHTSGRDGLADDVKTLDGLTEGFAPFHPLVWRDSLDRMLRVSREGREYRDKKTGWTWNLWDELSYLNLIHDDRWTKPGKNYVERYRRLLGKEPVGFLPALEIMTAMNLAKANNRPDPANELLQAGFTPEEADRELTESLKTLKDARLANAIVREYLPFLSRVDEEPAAVAQSLGGEGEALIAEEILQFATSPFQPSEPEYWPEEKAASALAGLQQFLKVHGRVIGDERGPFTDLTESLNVSRVYSFKDGDFEIVNAEFMKSSLDHQHIVYKSGAIIGYGTFALHPEFKRAENFRLAILEQRGTGNGFVALKLALRMVYRAYGPKGLERIYAPAFSEMEEGVWQDSLASRAPLFMVYAGFDPVGRMEGFDQMILPLRRGELSAGDKDRLNEALMEMPLALKLPAYSPTAASLGRDIPRRAEMEFVLKVALPHDQGGITEGILYINDETTLRWAMTELGLLEKPGEQNPGEAFQSLNRGELDRAILDHMGLDEDRLREGSAALVLFPGVLDTENPPDRDALAEAFTGALEAEDQVILVRRENNTVLDALIRRAGRRGIKVRTIQDPLVSASSIDTILKGELPIIISAMSEKRDLEINFKGRKFKFNDRELHGRIDKVKVIGLLRKIADYPDKFNLVGLTAKDGYWEIGGAFADFIEKLYSESRAAELQAKAA